MANLFIPPAQVFDDEGRVLASGTVWIYRADTSNLATVYADSGETAQSNPGVLSSGGRFAVWAPSAAYKTKIESSTNVPLYTVRDIRPVSSAASLQLGDDKWFVDIGTADSYAGTISPAPSALSAGLTVYMLAASTNTGAAVLNLNGFGAITIRRNNEALNAGDIVSGVSYALTYDGAYWQLHQRPRFAEQKAHTAIYKPNSTTGFAIGVETVVNFVGAGTVTLTGDSSFWTATNGTNFVVPSGVTKVACHFEGFSGTAQTAANIVLRVRKNGVTVSSMTPQPDRLSTDGPVMGQAAEWPPFAVTAGDWIQFTVEQDGISTMAYLTTYGSVRAIG